MVCPHCGRKNIIKYGKTGGDKKLQRYQCKDCERTFTEATNTVMHGSHSDRFTWLKLIELTIRGESLDECAKQCGVKQRTAFNMRHKLMAALQDRAEDCPVVLSGMAEFDETFVLDNYKGAKLPDNVGREPRKRNGKAGKPGVSNEHVAICVGIERSDGENVAVTVNRAHPDADELKLAFAGHINDGSIALADGLKSYGALRELADCALVVVCDDTKNTVVNLNTVNAYHSNIDRWMTRYRGVATKYLNRYNALFSNVFGIKTDEKEDRRAILMDRITSKIFQPGTRSYWHSVSELRHYKLVTV